MSHETFKVGEIAIVCGYTNWPEFLGTEVEIIGGCRLRTCVERYTRRRAKTLGYRVRRQDGVTAVYPPNHLRKRRPPQDWVKLCQLDNIPRDIREPSHV